MPRAGYSLSLSPEALARQLGIEKRVQDGLEGAGQVLQAAWSGDVLRRPGTGRLYEKGLRFFTTQGPPRRVVATQDDEEGRPADHRASAAGEPPASDEGALANSIDMDVEPGLVKVGSGSRVARWLNDGVFDHPGGITIEPRPHAEEAARVAERGMKAAMQRALEGTGVTVEFTRGDGG